LTTNLKDAKLAIVNFLERALLHGEQVACCAGRCETNVKTSMAEELSSMQFFRHVLISLQSADSPHEMAMSVLWVIKKLKS